MKKSILDSSNVSAKTWQKLSNACGAVIVVLLIVNVINIASKFL